MPPPTNVDAANAIDIGTLTGYTPYTVVQDAWDGVSASVALWYSYLPVTGDDMLEVYAYGNGTTYLPNTTIRSGPPPAAIALDNNIPALSVPLQQDIVTFVTPGERVFFRFLKASGNVNPSTTTIRIARAQKEPITHGDLFINDSAENYPGVVMARATAIPSRYQLDYPAGEGQQILRNGIVGVIDAFTLDGVVLYDVTSTGLTVRANPTMPAADYTFALGSNQIDTFLAVQRVGAGSHSFVVTVDQDGVVGTPLDLGDTSCNDAQPQADLSAIYWIRGSEIKKTTNPAGVLTTFLTVDATYNFTPNLLMLTDDTLLVGYEKAANAPYIKQFDLSGTNLTTTTLDVSIGTLIERIFADPQDPAYFWIWWQTPTANRFQRYALGNGTPLEDLTRTKFIAGVSATAALTAETVYSGADFSCVPVVIRLTTVTTATYTIRRQRRFLLPSSPDNKTVQIPTLELLMRTGIGLLPGDPADPPVLGADPQVMMRISKDGGKTWGLLRNRSAGLRGRWGDRIRWLRATGNYRNAVCEITVSDPVDWQPLAMLGEPVEGSS